MSRREAGGAGGGAPCTAAGPVRGSGLTGPGIRRSRERSSATLDMPMDLLCRTASEHTTDTI